MNMTATNMKNYEIIVRYKDGDDVRVMSCSATNLPTLRQLIDKAIDDMGNRELEKLEKHLAKTGMVIDPHMLD